MKKYFLLTLLGGCLLTAAKSQRLVLYEAFTSESNTASAAANPGLDALVSANPSKVVMVRYQSPHPAGPINLQNSTDVQARVSYYGVTFAPYGRMDGKVLGTGSAAGHVNFLSQTEIDNEAAQPSAFTINATHSWSADGDSIYATVDVQALSAFAPSGAQMKLRAALVEQLAFDVAPGTNHETGFMNVMRKMYPSGAGLSVPNAWAASQAQTFTVSGPVPSYVNKANGVFLVVWLQNDADKVVAQAGKSVPESIPLDAASDATIFPVSLYCTNAVTNVTANVRLKNAGTSPLTDAKIYYRLDNNPWQTYNWTGLIAPNGTTNVVLPGWSSTPGTHLFTDSVTLPNNAVDINEGNSKSSARVWVHNIVAVNLPQTTGFENGGGLPANWLLYDADNDTRNWQVTPPAQAAGHGGSTYSVFHNNYDYPDSEANYVVFPQLNMPAGPKSVDFYVAYAQFINEYDMLELVLSYNCGQTWEVLWGEGGVNLATAPATTSPYVPTQSQWRFKSVDISTLPTGALIALRATSLHGNNLYLDDITIRTGNSNGVPGIVANDQVRLYPNPARDAARLAFTLSEATPVKVLVMDAMGRTVSVAADGQLRRGPQEVVIQTAALPVGVYTVKLLAGGAALTERLVVVK